MGQVVVAAHWHLADAANAQKITISHDYLATRTRTHIAVSFIAKLLQIVHFVGNGFLCQRALLALYFDNHCMQRL